MQKYSSTKEIYGRARYFPIKQTKVRSTRACKLSHKTHLPQIQATRRTNRDRSPTKNEQDMPDLLNGPAMNLGSIFRLKHLQSLAYWGMNLGMWLERYHYHPCRAETLLGKKGAKVYVVLPDFKRLDLMSPYILRTLRGERRKSNINYY